LCSVRSLRTGSARAAIFFWLHAALFDSFGACFHLPPRQVLVSVSVFPRLISFFAPLRLCYRQSDSVSRVVRLILVWFPARDLFSVLPPVSDFSTSSLPLRFLLKHDLKISFSCPTLGYRVLIVFPAASKECRPIFCSSTCQRIFFLPRHFCCRNIFVPCDKDSFCLSFFSSLVFAAQDSFVFARLRQTAPLLRFESPSFDYSAREVVFCVMFSWAPQDFISCRSVLAGSDFDRFVC
jgi:hypothetical protein